MSVRHSLDTQICKVRCVDHFPSNTVRREGPLSGLYKCSKSEPLISLIVALFLIFSAFGAEVIAQAPPAVSANHAKEMEEGLAIFKAKVRPALVASCLECHGGKTKKADFDLSDRKPLIDSEAIEGGSAKSRLMALIRHAEEPAMPLKRPKLDDATIAAIGRWIDLGAPYDKPLTEAAGVAAKAGVEGKPSDFWSFQPLKVSAPPLVKTPDWAKTSIDRFILAKLDEKGIAPNPEADRRVLIRRLSFDLIGLPPTPEEVDQFLADTSPNAYESLVDRLLASPHYGERWARHWMDVARFAESHGYEQDYDRPHAYHYRDYLIKALNRDQPFDEFVHWQLAGDEVAPNDPLAMAATGFLGAGAFPTQLTEAEFESARYNELDDMTSTTGSAFLGLSIGCARCHDHKFDPIPSEDYYRIASTFTNTIRAEIDLKFDSAPDAKPVKTQITAEGYKHTSHHADGRGFPHFYPKTFILGRGDVNQKTAEATPGVLRVLNRADHSSDAKTWALTTTVPSTNPKAPKPTYQRAALARWITDTKNGAGALAARVAVNRVWQHHFGRGIVATPNDFGVQGEPPSHPELLEWLATDLVQGGWKLKRLHKLIVTSAVYRQSSAADEARNAADPENTLLWRWTPRRLEAEPIRDTLLSVAGKLDTTMYGPGTLDPAMTRRSVYFFIKRSQLIPTMMLFDWPEHLVSIGQRGVTTTAPQALMFMNSPLGRTAAEGLAGRVAGTNREEAVAKAYKIAFGREPSAEEAKIAAEFLQSQTAAHQHDAKSEPEKVALADFCQALLSMSELIYVP